MTRSKKFKSSTKRKLSEMISEMAAGFLGVGDTIGERQKGTLCFSNPIMSNFFRLHRTLVFFVKAIERRRAELMKKLDGQE